MSDAVDGLAPRFVVLLVSVFGWACNFFLHAGAQAVVVLFLCATFDQLAKGRSCHARDFVYRYGSRSTADKWFSPGCFGLQVIVAVVAVHEDEIGAVIVKSFADGRLFALIGEMILCRGRRMAGNTVLCRLYGQLLANCADDSHKPALRFDIRVKPRDGEADASNRIVVDAALPGVNAGRRVV